MDNTNQQIYTIYSNIQSFYRYRKLVSLDDEMTQDQFIKTIQKDKYVLLSSVDIADVQNSTKELDEAKLKIIKKRIGSFNEKSKDSDITITNILLIYPGTDCESKRANMMKLINHVRYPRSNVIIITPSKVSSGVSKGLQMLSSKREHQHHDFKAFTYTLLSSIIPKHELVPKYEILSKEQVDNLKEWFLDPESFPKIFENDPQMVWIGAKVGQVIKFTYLSEVTIEAIGYCKVVASM